MEVTRENFGEVEAEVVAAIRRAQFLAFDTEFTGN
jgi:hypothetical protein